MNEIIIKNGLIVIENQQFRKDIRIKAEKITEIENNLTNSEKDSIEINAHDLHILPGGIDPHVHLSLPEYVSREYRWADDFESGSKAALAGGITTLGCISVPNTNETPLETLEREIKTIQQQAIADFMIHPVIFTPTKEVITDIPLLKERGCNTIKIFMCTKDFDDHSLEYLQAIIKAQEANMLSMIHCEDYAIITAVCEDLVNKGKGSLKNYADSRPIISEVVATQRAIAMCEISGTPIYIVHLSSERALKVCEDAQERSLPVYIEGRPIFLYLTREKYLETDGALYVVQPPLREEGDREALWSGLSKGSIHTIATDHAPHTREQKLNPELNVRKLVPGINELQVMLPMLYSMGVLTNKVSLSQFVRLTSTNAAKLFGLYPQKGTIQIGSDADLVLWDFNEKRIIHDGDMFSKAGFSIYSGMEITGWPKMTIRRGEIVYTDRKIIAKQGSGKVVYRKQIEPLTMPLF